MLTNKSNNNKRKRPQTLWNTPMCSCHGEEPTKTEEEQPRELRKWSPGNPMKGSGWRMQSWEPHAAESDQRLSTLQTSAGGDLICPHASPVSALPHPSRLQRPPTGTGCRPPSSLSIHPAVKIHLPQWSSNCGVSQSHLEGKSSTGAQPHLSSRWLYLRTLT